MIFSSSFSKFLIFQNEHFSSFRPHILLQIALFWNRITKKRDFYSKNWLRRMIKNCHKNTVPKHYSLGPLTATPTQGPASRWAQNHAPSAVPKVIWPSLFSTTGKDQAPSSKPSKSKRKWATPIFFFRGQKSTPTPFSHLTVSSFHRYKHTKKNFQSWFFHQVFQNF